MLESLPLSYLTTPVGKALIGKFIPSADSDTLEIILGVVEELAKGNTDAKISDLLKDPMIVNLIQEKVAGSGDRDISLFKDGLVKCPSCGYVGKLSLFAPRLFEE